MIVAKLGGSLLGRPDLAARLARLVDHLRPEAALIVVGGGKFADEVRALDASHALGEARSHALALRALDLSARVVEAILPGSVVVEGFEAADDARALGLTPILAPRRFLEADDRDSPEPLPHAWTTTTDSIAARVADRLGASALVLLKSLDRPPEARTWQDAARLGLVDPEFPRAARNLSRVGWVNLARGLDPDPDPAGA